MLRILVAEDERITGKLMLHFLKRHGSCVLAADGQDAVLRFKEAHQRGEPFDVLFLDIMMPKMNGHEVLSAIRDLEAEMGIAVEQGVKVVIATVYDDPENVMEAHVAGCCRYMVKPLTLEKVNQALAHLGLVRVDGAEEGKLG